MQHPMACPILRWRPDRVKGMPIWRDSLAFAPDKPIARFHEKDNPGIPPFLRDMGAPEKWPRFRMREDCRWRRRCLGLASFVAERADSGVGRICRGKPLEGSGLTQRGFAKQIDRTQSWLFKAKGAFNPIRGCAVLRNCHGMPLLRGCTRTMKAGSAPLTAKAPLLMMMPLGTDTAKTGPYRVDFQQFRRLTSSPWWFATGFPQKGPTCACVRA